MLHVTKLAVAIDIEYMWIFWQGKNSRLFRLLTWSYWSLRSSSRRKGDGVKGVDGGYRFF